MKVKFLPEGGFNKNGAFVEYEGDEPSGDEPEYERPGYLNLEILCDQMEIRTVADVVNEYDEPDNPSRSVTKLICGTGKIQPARWRQFSLSFLGKKKTYDKVSLTIRSNEIGEAVSFDGLFTEADLDVDGWDEFYLDINVYTSRFDALVSELSVPGATLRAHIRTSMFPNFYATWSPAISEGREIKFLVSKRDVENLQDIPEDFWLDVEERKKLLSDPDNAPASIGVIRPIRSMSVSEEDKDRNDLDDDDYDNLEEPLIAQGEHSLRIERNNAILAQVDATALLTAQIRRTGRWVVLCFVVLIFAIVAN